MNFETLSSYCQANNVVLVAVSKTQSLAAVKALYDKGHRIFGENKVQELMDKKDLLPSDIQWHVIGHLQTNKIKQILPFVTMIHSVDSMKLMNEIQHEAQKLNRNISILLQVRIAQEDTKFGLETEEYNSIIANYNDGLFPNISILGLMGMASFVEDQNQIRAEFQKLKSIFDETKSSIKDQHKFNTLSMGMSGDYKLAIDEGSTMVRIGSLLFGDRIA